ncbi:Odorant receptor 096 [Nylanderia fulva]|uniref:Odorant receptor n=1 Tax=Nylanderia fulva TaxID=613905 RepID=A0A6G1LPF7_9HYME|nr:Odorant receptor 096 [Nylanderia fulva]
MDNSKYSGYEEFERAVKLNRISLEMMGLWPKARQNYREKLMCNLRVLFIFVAIISSILIPSVHSLIITHSDLMQVVDNLQSTVPGVNCVLKIVIFWRKKEGLDKLEESEREEGDDEKSRSRANNHRDRVFPYGIGVHFYCHSASFGITTRYITNITDPGRPMPVQTHYVYDITKTPQYELTYIVLFFSCFFTFACYAGIDNFLALVVFHICGQLDILRYRFLSLDRFTNFHAVLKSCVMDHMRLLRAIAVVEETYNAIFLILFLCNGVLFAFYGFLIINLLTKENDVPITRLVYLISNTSNIFAHTCLYCAIGEILMTQCDRIYYAVFNQEWYILEPSKARDLIPIIIKTRKPVYLTAGKIFPITMATFCSLIKTSAGYISVLLNMSA